MGVRSSHYNQILDYTALSASDSLVAMLESCFRVPWVSFPICLSLLLVRQ